MKKVKIKESRLLRDDDVPLLCPLHQNSTDHCCSSNCAWFSIEKADMMGEVEGQALCQNKVLGILPWDTK